MLGFAELGWAGIALTGFAIGKLHDAVHAVVRRRGLASTGFLVYAQSVMYPALIYSNAIWTLAICWILVVFLSGRHDRAGTGTRAHEFVAGSAGHADQAR